MVLNLDKNLVLVSSAICFRGDGKDRKWLLVKNSEEGDLEFPRTMVRKVESSVRASIRMMGEQGGITVRVLEEAGRAGGVTSVNNKIVPQRHIYYLMMHLSDAGEEIGFIESSWVETSGVTRKLSTKREKQMFQDAKKILKEWEKTKKKEEEEEAAAKAKAEASL